MDSSSGARGEIPVTELVTDVLSSGVIFAEFRRLVRGLRAWLGDEIDLSVQAIGRNLPNPESSRMERVPVGKLAAITREVEAEQQRDPGWLELEVSCPAVVLRLCNDLDIHVKSSAADLLAATRKHLASRGIFWYE
jgi:hypothetical protein